MNKKKVVIIVGGLVGVGTALYFIFRKQPYTVVGSFIGGIEDKIKGTPIIDEKTEVTTTIKNPVSGGSVSISSTGCSGYKTESFPLAKCMKGSKVKEAQRMINKLYGDKTNLSLKEDGYFGPNTETAVRASIGSIVIRESDFYQMQSAYKAISNF